MAADPYQVATAEQLIAIGSDPNLLDKHFILVSDIDLDPNVSPAYAFDRSVIGTEASGFSGVFDGNGFRVRHLTIRAVVSGQFGLFAAIGLSGEVKNLVIEEVNIICASSEDGTGAICGFNGGIVLRCYATGTISGKGLMGGLIGRNWGIVEECGSGCTVSATDSGGLVGGADGDVRDCYASGHVSGSRSAGGVVGGISRGGIRRCYGVGKVNGKGSDVGGLVGLAGSPLDAADSYFLAPADGGGPDNGIGTPLASQQMKQAGSFPGWDFWGATDDTLRKPWYMPEGSYPQLTWLALAAVPRVSGLSIEDASKALRGAGVEVRNVTCDYDHAAEYGCVILTRPCLGEPPGTVIDIIVSLGPYDWSTNPGKGEPNAPYLILSAGQLDCMTHQPRLWDRHFKLLGDLDMASRVYSRALIGRSGQGSVPFDGTFDGNGCIIKNLTIEGVSVEGDGPEVLGLFGEIASSGSVKDLGLRDVSVRGRRYHQEIGGMLCGINGGRIKRCYAQGQLHGSGRIGGLVGRNVGVIENCYATGQVEDLSLRDTRGFYAGLVAENVTGTINTCYAACTVPKYGHGLVGRNERGSLKNSLWDLLVSGVPRSDGGGWPVSTLGLMDAMVLRVYGWGGNPNWVVDDGKDYPRLIWEGTPGSLVPGKLGL